MATTNDNAARLSVLVIRNATGVDIDATVAEARKEAEVFAKDDKEATKAVIEVTNKILNSDKPQHKELTVMTASVLAKMALGLMGEIPTDKLCAETEVRVKSYLQGQPTKFLCIERGRNAGFHFIDRLNKTPAGKEQLAKLLKEKETSDAKKAAEAATAAPAEQAAE